MLIGAEAFKRGMDLYFHRHDGEATTIEAFIACFAESAGRDLQPFMRWYNQAGTPFLTLSRRIENDDLLLTFTQATKATPGQAEKGPQVIPIRLGLMDKAGVEHCIDHPDVRDGVFVLADEAVTLRLPKAAGLTPSVLRGFSAPVELRHDLTVDEIARLARHDTDSFNRWQAVQDLALRILTDCGRDGGDASSHPVTPALTAALADVVASAAPTPPLPLSCSPCRGRRYRPHAGSRR